MKQSLFILTTILILLSLCTKSKTSSQENKIATVTKNKKDTNSLNNSATNNIPQENKYFPFSAIKVAVGGKHSLIVDSDSTVWVSGCNEYGQLGIGDTVSNIVHFRKIMDGACDVAAGNNHSLILKGDGSLWAAGENSLGQFGTNDKDRSLVFVKISTDVAAIAAKGYCSMIIKRDSTLWVAGKNDNYYFGIGKYDPRKDEGYIRTFKKVMSSVHSVSIGDLHSLVLKYDGTVWGAGDNRYDQLGFVDTSTQESNSTYQTYTYEFVELTTDAIAIAAGGYHSLILKKDSTLWATGWNEYGQLGTGDNNDRHGFEMVLSKVLAIAAGNRMTFALRTDSILWATGGNGYGDNPKYDDYDNKERTLFRRDLENVRSIATSWDAQGTFQGFSLAIKNDGTVWGFGGDGWGVFGRGISELGSWSELQHM